jgi:hypothetical protein
MSFKFLPVLSTRYVLISVFGLFLALMILNQAWISASILALIGIGVYLGLRNLRSVFSFKVYDHTWRYGAIVGAGLLVAMLASWAFLGWTTIIFVLGALAISLIAYAIVLSLQRISIPNSVINVTTDIKLKAPRFRNWGRYVLKAELTTELSTAKGKTKRIHTKRMHVKVHREDFPEGRLVEACHQFVQNFVEKERQYLAKTYPDTPLVVDQSYFKQVHSLPLPTTTNAVTYQSDQQPSTSKPTA